jgi:hypothetical protein
VQLPEQLSCDPGPSRNSLRSVMSAEEGGANRQTCLPGHTPEETLSRLDDAKAQFQFKASYLKRNSPRRITKNLTALTQILKDAKLSPRSQL